MASIFSRIIARELPAYIVAEDDRFIAFLDISPLMRGHTLVVPKQETDYLFDIDDQTLEGLIVFSKRVASAIKASVPCVRVAVAVLGLEVPHAHVHLIPMNNMSDANFSNPKLKLTKEEFEAIAVKIRSAVAN
jgi:histidine triad (HIT) family protein